MRLSVDTAESSELHVQTSVRFLLFCLKCWNLDAANPLSSLNSLLTSAYVGNISVPGRLGDRLARVSPDVGETLELRLVRLFRL